MPVRNKNSSNFVGVFFDFSMGLGADKLRILVPPGAAAVPSERERERPRPLRSFRNDRVFDKDRSFCANDKTLRVFSDLLRMEIEPPRLRHSSVRSRSRTSGSLAPEDCQ